jgi:hypothetical protein
MSTDTQPSLTALRDRFRQVLSTAMLQRPDRPHLQDFGHGYEPRWASYERTVMHIELNRARAELGRPELSGDAVRRVESGHVDYFETFVSYYADLVLAPDAPVQP